MLPIQKIVMLVLRCLYCRYGEIMELFLFVCLFYFKAQQCSEFMEKVFAVGFTDSEHILVYYTPREVNNWFIKVNLMYRYCKTA